MSRSGTPSSATAGFEKVKCGAGGISDPPTLQSLGILPTDYEREPLLQSVNSCMVGNPELIHEDV
jgi:hypothetical protein